MRRRWPFLLVGGLWYLGTLVPMIGVVQVGIQQMADRYTYFPMLGIYIALRLARPPLVERTFVGRRTVSAGIVTILWPAESSASTRRSLLCKSATGETA